MNDFVYCDDVAQAVTRALDARGEGYRLLQIGSGRLDSLHQFVDVVRKIIPTARISVGDGLDYAGRGLGSYFQFEISAVLEVIEYDPEFDLKRGIEDYVCSLENF